MITRTLSRRKYHDLAQFINILTAYRIQGIILWYSLMIDCITVSCIGTEFQAVFLSTTEPVDNDGNTTNPTKSPCDPYVFNTVLTRSKSLVVAVGSPMALLRIEEHMVKKYGGKARCWSTYMKLCLEKNTFTIPSAIEPNDKMKKEFKSALMTKLSNTLRTLSDINEEVSTNATSVSGVTSVTSANEQENMTSAGQHSNAATSHATTFPGNQPTLSMRIPLPTNDSSALQLENNQSHVAVIADQRPIPASLSLSHKVSSLTPTGKSRNQNKTSPINPPAIPGPPIEPALAHSSLGYRNQPGNQNLPWMKTSPVNPPARHPVETASAYSSSPGSRNEHGKSRNLPWTKIVIPPAVPRPPVEIASAHSSSPGGRSQPRKSGNQSLLWTKASPVNPPAAPAPPVETASSSLGYRRHVVPSKRRSPGKSYNVIVNGTNLFIVFIT